MSLCVSSVITRSWTARARATRSGWADTDAASAAIASMRGFMGRAMLLWSADASHDYPSRHDDRRHAARFDVAGCPDARARAVAVADSVTDGRDRRVGRVVRDAAGSAG